METKCLHLVTGDHKPLSLLNGKWAWRSREQGRGKVEKRLQVHQDVIATVLPATFQNLQGLSFLLEFI